MADTETEDLSSQKTKDPNALTPKFVRDQYDRGIRGLRKQQYEYVRNLAFLDGQQWIQYNTLQNRWTSIPKDPERVQVTFNVLRPDTRILMSKLLSRDLVFEVQPGDTDSASVRGAQLAEAIIYDLHCDHQWENLRADAGMAAFVGGTSILAIDWNARAGDVIDHMPITGEAIGTGELEESVLSIAEVAWEPGTKIAEKSYWWCRAQALPSKLVQQTYGLKKLPKSDVQGQTTPISALLSQGVDSSTTDTDLTLVITYYERPNPQRPKGAIVTLVNEEFVSEPVDWYFPFKDYLNMAVIRETKVPGQAAGETVFSDACKIQKSYNDAWSNLLEHHKKAGTARMLIPEGSLDGIEDLSDLPSEYIPFNEQSGKPSYLEPPTMPTWWMQGVDKLRAELDDVLSVHDVSRGQAPTNVDSGVGLSILAEQDNTPIGNLTKELVRGFEKLASMALQIYSVKVTETRTANINRDVHPESVEWTGKAISGQTKPAIPIDKVMPRSHAADFAMAKDLFINKIITDPMDFIRIAQTPGYKSQLAVIDPHANKAERENHLMSMGKICIPADFDDHRRHIELHNRFRTTIRYESMDDQDRQMVDEHIKAHEVLAAEQAGEQEAKLNVSPGLANVPTASGQEPILPPPLPASLPNPANLPPQQQMPTPRAIGGGFSGKA